MQNSNKERVWREGVEELHVCRCFSLAGRGCACWAGPRWAEPFALGGVHLNGSSVSIRKGPACFAVLADIYSSLCLWFLSLSMRFSVGD